MTTLHSGLRFCAAFVLAVLLCGCGFHLRGEVRLAPTLQRVRVSSSDPNGALKRGVEDGLRRAGAAVEENPGAGIAEVKLSGVSASTVVGSVGRNARVNEYVMVYHADVEVVDAAGKTLLEKQPLEQQRRFTFDQTQAVGTAAEQDVIRREMERDMIQAVLRRIDLAERRLAQ